MAKSKQNTRHLPIRGGGRKLEKTRVNNLKFNNIITRYKNIVRFFFSNVYFLQFWELSFSFFISFVISLAQKRFRSNSSKNAHNRVATECRVNAYQHKNSSANDEKTSHAGMCVLKHFICCTGQTKSYTKALSLCPAHKKIEYWKIWNRKH